MSCGLTKNYLPCVNSIDTPAW